VDLKSHLTALRSKPTHTLSCPTTLIALPVEWSCQASANVSRSEHGHADRVHVYHRQCSFVADYGSCAARNCPIVGILQLCFWSLGVSETTKPTHKKFLAQENNNRYSTMDNIDGKQARRTGTSSGLGELFEYVHKLPLLVHPKLRHYIATASTRSIVR